MSSNNWLAGELVSWAAEFNMKYVMVLENMVNDVFSLHQRSDDGHGELIEYEIHTGCPQKIDRIKSVVGEF